MLRLRLLPVLFLAAACGSTSQESAPAPAPVAPAAPPAVAPAAEPEPAAPAPVAGALAFTAQAEWIEEPPSSAMRKAQFRLPGAAGEATLVVFHFGPQAGTLEANLTRWAGQFEQPDGGDSSARMTREQRRVGELDVLVVDLAGTYVAETFPGSGEHLRQEDWRMLAAVIDTAEGPYYAKLVGPTATVAAHAERFDAFLAALR